MNKIPQKRIDRALKHYLLHEHKSPLNEILHQTDLKVEMQYHKDIEDAYKAGYEKGQLDMRKEMMKMAEDTAGLSLSWGEDSKTKIIIIEEEEQ